MALEKHPRIISPKTIAECKKDYSELSGKPAQGEPHHIRPRSLGGSDIKENLIQLAFDEHRDAHDGRLSYAKLVAVVAKRESLTISDVCQLIGWPVPNDTLIEVADVPAISGHTLDEIIQMYISLQENEDDSRWAKGAVCLALMEGMKVSQYKIAAWFGCSASQVFQLAKTFKAFSEASTRVAGLDWFHHRVAAGSKDPERWIAEAADEELSTRQMQEQIDLSEGKVAKKDLRQEKADKALLLIKEVLSYEDDVADRLRARLLDLVVLPAVESVPVEDAVPVEAAVGL